MERRASKCQCGLTIFVAAETCLRMRLWRELFVTSAFDGVCNSIGRVRALAAEGALPCKVENPDCFVSASGENPPFILQRECYSSAGTISG